MWRSLRMIGPVTLLSNTSCLAMNRLAAVPLEVGGSRQREVEIAGVVDRDHGAAGDERVLDAGDGELQACTRQVSRANWMTVPYTGSTAVSLVRRRAAVQPPFGDRLGDDTRIARALSSVPGHSPFGMGAEGYLCRSEASAMRAFGSTPLQAASSVIPGCTGVLRLVVRVPDNSGLDWAALGIATTLCVASAQDHFDRDCCRTCQQGCDRPAARTIRCRT